VNSFVEVYVSEHGGTGLPYKCYSFSQTPDISCMTFSTGNLHQQLNVSENKFLPRSTGTIHCRVL